MERTGRAGSLSNRQSRTATLKGPDPNSKTSKRRRNRGFKSLEVSCRIHRRAALRSICSRTQYGKVHEPGTKVSSGSDFVHTAGGSIKYY